MTRRPLIHWSSACLASSIVLCSDASAAVFTVGSGAGCTHGTIQSALNAASAAPGADTVRLTRSLTYEPEANTINDSQNLNLVGGFATCTQAATDNIKTVVSGSGGAAASVLRVFAGTGVIVKLRHLNLTLGDPGGDVAGGGIYFQGDGALEIIESSITNNTAGSGGGIYALATGSNAELIISASTLISGNTARNNGGGVSIAGPLEMTMTAPSSLIAFNDALGQGSGTGYGGGLQVSGPAIAYLGTSGQGGLGAIYSNSAVDGGGISIISGSSGGADALVHLFTTNPSQPIMVRGNAASDTGGGIYLQSWTESDSLSRASLCAEDFRIEDNFARDGSAIYENSDSDTSPLGFIGGKVHLNHPSCARAGAIRCASGVPCNTVSDNDTVADTSPAAGATLRLLRGATIQANRFEMRGNRGGYAIRSAASGGPNLSTCLIANNEVTRQLIRTESTEGESRIVDCTIADNLLGSQDVLHMEGALFLKGSIIHQPGYLTIAYSGAPGLLNVQYVLASDISTLPNSPLIVRGNPAFVAAASGDFHLSRDSLAVDFAPFVPGDDRDLDNLPRDQDVACVSDLYGVRDLGAYERQAGEAGCDLPDAIFRNGLESP
jgi:hypothetical protein